MGLMALNSNSDSAPDGRCAQRPLFSFGLVADVQAGHKPNGFSEGRKKDYEAAFSRLEEAVAAWSLRCLQPTSAQRHPLSFVLSLGDLIDGNDNELTTSKDLADVLKMFARLPCQVHHVIGNHCLKFCRRQVLLEKLMMSSPHYRIDIAPKWRLVVLDTTSLSLHGAWEEGSPELAESRAYLKERTGYDATGVQYNDAKAFLKANVHPGEERWQTWNGGLRSVQLDWLRNELELAKVEKVSVVLASHHCLAKGACRETHRAWNGDDVTALITETGVVAIALAGHDHLGGFAEVGGVPFLTLPAMLESSEANAYAVVNIYPDRLEIDGCGTGVASQTFALRTL